jgi:cystathionine gamma-synthase/methionine-gamma-lyase
MERTLGNLEAILDKRTALATQVIHAGRAVETANLLPSSPPIHSAVTYRYPHSTTLDAVLSGRAEGFAYRRLGSPTVDCLEGALAELEGTESAVACQSGMAALHLALLAAGANPTIAVLAADDLYGGTHALLTEVFAAQGANVVFGDLTDLHSVSQLLEQIHARVIVAETFSNPLLKVCDLPALAQLAHSVGARIVVDNTFATPVLYRPALDGADYVVHSATKYLSGHGDILAGIVAASGTELQKVRGLQQTIGHVIDPAQAWLLLRSLRTLVLRMRQHCANALGVARFLCGHQRVTQVHYPGLPSSPHFALARRLFPSDMYGGVVSFEIREAEEEQVFRFMDALKLVSPATSLGDVGSLVLYPWNSSHRSLSAEAKLALGIGRGLVRLSVGIEDASDIISDLGQALEQA